MIFSAIILFNNNGGPMTNMWKNCILFIPAFLLISANISFSKPFNEVWMEIYSDNNKVGYIQRTVSGAENNRKINEKTLININLLGVETEMSIISEYHLKDNKINSFSYNVDSSSVELKLKGEIQDEKLTIVDLADEKTQEFKLKHNYIVSSLLPEYIIENGLKEGSSFEVYIFDPVNIYTGYDPELLIARVKVFGKEKLDTKSGIHSAYKVSVNFLGGENTVWITENGKPVLEKFEPSLTAVISSRSEALKKRNKAFDIAEKTSIVSNKYIHNPREVKKMIVKIHGLENIEGLNVNDGNYQVLSNKKLTVSSPDLTSPDLYSLPYEGSDFMEYLESSILIQKDNQAIIQQVEKIVKSEKNPIVAVKLINDWTYRNIKKIPTVSIPSAVEVLNTLEGDCNEHAVLFAALARAAGIPVKVILGVVYLDGRFYYHAWNEVYIGKWVPIDSTFGQIPADATHLKIIEGDISRSPDILKVVGKMKLEVIETK